MYIGFSCDEDLAGIMKKKLHPYADELEWEIIVRRDEEEEKRVTIALLPPKKGDDGHWISPLELFQLKRKLSVLTRRIESELDIEDLTRNMSWKITRYEGDLDEYSIEIDDGLLVIGYNMEDRVKLEKKDPKLALELFDENIDDFLENTEISKKNEKSWKEWVNGVTHLIQKYGLELRSRKKEKSKW